MARFQLVGKVVEGVNLLRRRHWAWRLDCWPFAILYSVWIFVALPSLDFTDACILLGGLPVFHILVLLFTSWSVDFRCFVHFTKISIAGRGGEERLSSKRDKNHILFGGTKILQHSPDKESSLMLFGQNQLGHAVLRRI